MSKTVIRFQEDSAGNVQFYLEWPPGVVDGKKLFTLKSRAGDAEFQFGQPAPAVATAGAKLRDDLLGHAGIKMTLEAWLGMADRAYQPLHLELESAAADQLPWEALVDGKGSFLALDKNSPVARVLSAERQDKLKKEVLFTAPLRIACVLGAWWEDGGAAEQAQEWESLKAALAAPDAAALKVDVCVYGCDPTLEAQVKATALPGVNVQWEPIVGNAPTLLKRIRAFRPHMLHLYAHGIADDQPYVAVSTVADAEAGQDASVLLGAKEVRQEGDPDDNIWVIALNSCETAAISKDARNLASQLVRFGFPAVIGMREPVKTVEARIVTQHFYEAAFEALNSVPIGGAKRRRMGAVSAARAAAPRREHDRGAEEQALAGSHPICADRSFRDHPRQARSPGSRPHPPPGRARRAEEATRRGGAAAAVGGGETEDESRVRREDPGDRGTACLIQQFDRPTSS